MLHFFSEKNTDRSLLSAPKIRNETLSQNKPKMDANRAANVKFKLCTVLYTAPEKNLTAKQCDDF